MEKMSQPLDPSDRSREISKMYASEADRASRDENGAMSSKDPEKLPKVNEHRDMCIEYLDVPEILPDSLLKKRLEEISLDSHLKEHFPAGRRIQLLPIPFSVNGNRLDSKEIEDGDYVRNLIIHEYTYDDGSPVLDSSGNQFKKVLSGFSLYQTDIHKLIPSELTECSFIVPPYSDPGLHRVTEEERQHIMDEYEKAFKKMQELLR